MIYQKLKCKFNIHKWIAIGRNSEYYTTYTDRNDYKRYWIMSFYQCSCCGQRKFTHNYEGYGKHHGIELAKLNWIEYGEMPKDTIVRNELLQKPVKPKAKILNFTLINGDKNE
jgi:hypothetical protein